MTQENNDRCGLCGGYVERSGSGVICWSCFSRYEKEKDEGKIPENVKPRFFDYGDWLYLRMQEKKMMDGRISREEAQRNCNARVLRLIMQAHMVEAREREAEEQRQRQMANRLV